MKESHIKIIENNLESLISNPNMGVKDYSVRMEYFFEGYVDPETDEPLRSPFIKNFKSIDDAIIYIDKMLENPPKLECPNDELLEIYEKQKLESLSICANYVDKLLGGISLSRLLIGLVIIDENNIGVDDGILISKEKINTHNTAIQSKLKSIIENGKTICDYTVSIYAGSCDLDGPVFENISDATNYLWDYLSHITYYSEYEDELEIVDEANLFVSTSLEDDPSDVGFETLFSYNMYRDE